MSDKVINVQHVSKIYRLGEIGSGTLSSDVNRWWVTKVLGKEDPYLKIGQVNHRSTKGDTDVVYSLKDISFDVGQGEVLGIIGKNGAGKSTLLKILSRITAPTTGRVRMKGRVASLLEVGTGFHPELTGRENIFLNGSILGMRKHEIARKLDEIVDFSGVERYIDTPVKRYSSGMYVRLAFSVAAHLESEILIVDEVLAVGDAEFQKKCLGRMKDVSVNEGRTVLFVSHNLEAISNVCKSGLLVENGALGFIGKIGSTVERYVLGFMGEKKRHQNFALIEADSFGIFSVEILNETSIVKQGEVLKIQFNLLGDCMGFNIGCAVFNSRFQKISTSVYYCQFVKSMIYLEIPSELFLSDTYYLDFAVFKGKLIHQYFERALAFQVVDYSDIDFAFSGDLGNIKIKCKWY